MRSTAFKCLVFAAFAAACGMLLTEGRRQGRPTVWLDCQATLPASCQMPIPSWSTQIQPIVEASCKPCHFPGGQALIQGFTVYNFSTYESFVRAPRTTMEGQLRSCAMPLPDGGGYEPLSTADRDLLLDWLVCDEPVY